MASQKTPNPARAASGGQAVSVPGEQSLVSLARQVRRWADTLIGVAASATDMGLTLAQTRIKDPRKRAAVGKAGAQLRRWREAAGLTVGELAGAVGLGDAKLIEEAEGGLASLPFEVVLRLASVLGRHDPIPVAMALTRQYNPALWKALEAAGVGRLAVQGTRERELANLYRASDAARQLDDEQFARVLAFTRQGFEMAVAFAGAERGAKRPAAAHGRHTAAGAGAKVARSTPKPS